MARLDIRLKNNACVEGLSPEELEGIACSLQIDSLEDEKMVVFSEKPPFDRTKPWQLLNASGKPVGGIRYYDDYSNEWQDITGTSGPVGPEGPKGDKGDKGDDGSQGVQGVNGQKGDKGDDGAQGGQGPQGIPGNTGVQGDPGPDGPTGNQGPIGQTGPPGQPGNPGNQFPSYDLAGGNLLVAEAFNFDTFSANREFATLPNPTSGIGGDFGTIKLLVEATVSVDLDFHTNNTNIYQTGVAAPAGLNPITSDVTITSGIHTIQFDYVGSKWIMQITP